MLILKLGGASITDKTSPNTPQQDAIAAIAQQIARYPQPMVLIHGAGSYGHILAQEAQLHMGYQDNRQRPALIQLQQQLGNLNRIVVQALNNAGIQAITVQPASMCVQDSGRIADLFLEPVERILGFNMVPVLYGDCVWDRAQGFSIISGDQLAVYLANALSAERLAFGTNVDGVLDSAGQVIPELNAWDMVAEQSVGAARADVTGGMLGKLQEIGGSTAPAFIFNLQNMEQLARILAGQAAGTRINVQKGLA